MRILIFLLAATLLFSCKSDTEEKTDDPPQDDPKTYREQGGTDEFATIQFVVDEENLVGHYVGPFKPNKITLTFYEITNEGVKGYSTVAGNHRPLTGTINKEGKVYHMELKEPGDDEWDGMFAVTLDPETKTVSGTFTPYDKGTKKSFMLEKRDYEYNPTAGIYKNTSTDKLNPEDLYDYMQDELRLMRNEIYARHGYSFKKKDMRAHFDAQDWYMPLTTDVRDMLSDREWQNVQLIKEYEEYADEFYDEFGR